MAVGIERARRRFTIEEYERMAEAARAGIPEYWIVDANTETLEIYHSPSGERYAERRRPARDERGAPFAFPDAALPVASIFV